RHFLDAVEFDALRERFENRHGAFTRVVQLSNCIRPLLRVAVFSERLNYPRANAFVGVRDEPNESIEGSVPPVAAEKFDIACEYGRVPIPEQAPRTRIDAGAIGGETGFQVLQELWIEVRYL